MTIVLTGSSGLVGRHLLDILPTDRLRLLARRLVPSADCEVVKGDLVDLAASRELVDGAEMVIHCAAELSDESRMHLVNVKATVDFARAAADAGVDAFCYISSAGVVGPQARGLVREIDACHPESPYERSKWLAECALTELAGSSKMRVCIIRPTNVVDRQQPGIVSPMLRKTVKSQLMLFVKGREGAHLVHAGDVAAAVKHLMFHCGGSAGTFFVGCDEDPRNTVAGLWKLICSEQGVASQWPELSLPADWVHVLRSVVRGTSLHGSTRFSSERLLDTGFSAPLGLEGLIRDLCSSCSGTA